MMFRSTVLTILLVSCASDPRPPVGGESVGQAANKGSSDAKPIGDSAIPDATVDAPAIVARDVSPPDSSGDDAREVSPDSSRDGGQRDAASPDASAERDAGMGTSPGWYDDTTCRECEMRHCVAFSSTPQSQADDRYTPCIGPSSERVPAGSRQGDLVTDLCSEIRQCYRASGCVATDDFATTCLCGTAMGMDCLEHAKRTGICKDIIAAGTHVSNPDTESVQVTIRLYDRNYTTGKANRLVQCDLQHCRKECWNLPPRDAGP